MSRIGKKPVTIPKGVTASVNGQEVAVKGPKGELKHVLVDDVIAKLEDGSIEVSPRQDTQNARAMWGMSRTLISNLMTGVTEGGCFLVHNGKIEKSVKDFRFVESMYFILNRLVAIGSSQRTAFGYAPWHGSWPIEPTIVPPLMVDDFNFVALAEAV